MNHHPRRDAKVLIALLWRGDPTRVETPTPANNRLYPLFKAFADLNVSAVPVPYTEEATEEIRARLLEMDGVLVWVDPITDGRDRSKLDHMLQDLSEHGVWVSAHPKVIQSIGTKDVLFETRRLGWGANTHLYRDPLEFKERFPASLNSANPRVLKQRRGNGGIGTWKVELASYASKIAHSDPIVRVQEARRGSAPENLALSTFMSRCEKYFLGGACLIDQEFQSRTEEGMIRCYLVHDAVVGFSTQKPTRPGDFVMARDKTMYEPSEPRFEYLKAKMESEWVPELQQLFSIDRNSLPVIWDADFLYGPKNREGGDTYVLGEINVSAVLPFPLSAVEKIAQAALSRMQAAKAISRH